MIQINERNLLTLSIGLRGNAGRSIGAPASPATEEGACIAPSDVAVQLYADPRNGEDRFLGELLRGEPIIGATNGHIYTGTAPATRRAEEYTVRIIPYFFGSTGARRAFADRVAEVNRATGSRARLIDWPGSTRARIFRDTNVIEQTPMTRSGR